MGVIENAKDLAGLIQKYSEAGLYRKILELEDESGDLRRKLRKAETDLEEARGELVKRGAMKFRPPYYWKDGDETPFCPKCWEGKDKLDVHLSARRRNFAGILRDCLQCKSSFWEERFNQQGPR
jgi:hypothetical protein